MTVLTSESRLGMTNAQMPRVNLLPPEIAEKAFARKVQLGLGAGLAASVAVVGLLVVSAGHSVTAAQSSVDAANATNTKLKADVAKYNNVTAVYAAAEAAQAQLKTAMGQEVRYSQLLHDLSLSVPSTVWLKNLAYTQTAAVAAPTATGAAGAAATPVATGIGTVSFQGIGFDHNDLALWLESLAKLKQYGNVYFSNSTEGLIGDTKKVVNFTTTADMTPAALSGRYLKPLGG